MKEIRVDRWLWNVRLFKSRTKANRACKKKKVKINNDTAKPSSNVKHGDIILFKKGAYTLTVKVLSILKTRRSYSIAKECYEDITPPEEYEKYKNWFYNPETTEQRPRGAGRPTKKDRRELDDFKRLLYDTDF